MRQTVNLNGKKTVIDTERPRVAKALVALVEACAVREWPIGMIFEHETGVEYQLVRIKQSFGFRAYLINTETGRARNSRKVVYVEGTENKSNGYVTDLPAEKDKFYDPDGDNGEFIDC